MHVMQTEGGAPLSGADTRPAVDGASGDGSTPARPATRWGLIGLLLAVAAFVVVVDQLTKIWVVATMPGRDPIQVVGSLLQVTYTRNSGAAFSIGTGAHLDLHRGCRRGGRGHPAHVPPARLRRPGRWPWAPCSAGRWATSPTGCSVTPGLGRGHVVDWIQLPHYPVFNLADAAIGLRGDRHGAALGLRAGPRRFPPPMSGERRTLPVPDGLEGERVDAGLARLFGLSRTRAADLAERGLVLLDGVTVGKSDRLSAGGWLDVELPSTEQPPAAPPEVVARPGRAVTTTTTSWWWTSRSGWPPTPAPAGPGRP